MRKTFKKARIGIVVLLAGLLVLTGCGSQPSAAGSGQSASAKAPIKIGIVTSQTGALEAYGQQSIRGFKLGIDYATKGTNEVAGHPIDVIIADSETRPDVAKQKAIKLLEDNKVDILVGCASSTDALAILPLAKQYKKVMVVEPAVADAITGSQWNRYIFRTGRNSSQDAIAGAAAIAKPGVKIAVLAPDNAFGRDGEKAFKLQAEKLGAKIVAQEFPAANATDFTANIQRIINAKPNYLFVIWAGANTPWQQLADMKVARKGIKLSTGAPDIAALKTMWNAVGMEGFCVYYYGLPKNPINDWLVKEHMKKYHEPPDLFTAGGMSAAMAIVTALQKTDGNANADKLISTMEGMSFETPKGEMTFRKQDHQALQTMYAIRLEKEKGVDWPVPVLMRTMTPAETAPPIQNGR
ncbi:Periplasmic binding protein-like attachment site profile [Acididesulfobacillus acetoxydans]|uniref:Branched-chain amino acid ABC transporter, branched chain amino acid-binding protein n=1 Tax=Acididesulfobacillus acetoxydans TaxID=1561005 RepID=A0A8S0X2Q5_9FIRM|nr:substrate-binding domain-containing protein [Acididesulfobacillus acetoxydans]CAA7599410.1 Periplasmic binding protein-like attachment site profile [Acididesulfobacillus acetoxydans]CEJ06784.1 Branched-chain amino acid ABC transporter, branched chain amino acid-binding protein [Acididesulfobacillus acetoxydans]